MKTGTIIALLILLWPAIQAILAKVAERKLKEQREEDAAKRRTVELPGTPRPSAGVPKVRPKSKATAVQRREEIIARRKAQMGAAKTGLRSPSKGAASTVQPDLSRRPATEPRRQPAQGRQRQAMPPATAPEAGPRPVQAADDAARVRVDTADVHTITAAGASGPLEIRSLLSAGPRAMRNWIIVKEILDPPVSMR